MNTIYVPYPALNFFFYQQMGNTVFPVSSVAKDLSLVAKVLRNSGNYSGALNLNYREFSKIYEYINQLGERHKYHCFLVMVTMETAPDSMMYIENIEQAHGARCTVCFRLRLEETARQARAHGFDYFGTTLTVSPHKDAQRLNAIDRKSVV